MIRESWSISSLPSLSVSTCLSIVINPRSRLNWFQTPLDTERTAAGFIKFLSAHATHKFTAPEVSEPEPETEPELEQEHDDDDQTEEEGEESVDEEEVKDEL